jgi:hypothetical protein
MRTAIVLASAVSTGALLLWLVAASVAVQRLRERGAPVSRGASVFLALLGSRAGFRALLYLLWGKELPADAPPIVGHARDWGRVIAPSWFLIAGVASLMWLNGAL